MAYLGEILLLAGTFAPRDWQFCDGQLDPISENDPLIQWIGTTYGGDGDGMFAVPNPYLVPGLLHLPGWEHTRSVLSLTEQIR